MKHDPFKPKDSARKAAAPDISDRRLVLHVVECFAGGVASAIKDYARNTPEFEHYLYYAKRKDAPVSEEFFQPFAWCEEMPATQLARIRGLRAVVKAIGKPCIIHAHSSFAGVYVRLALVRGRNLRIVYTPHGFAFIRKDVSALTRGAFAAIELVLALNTTVYAPCSVHEGKLARRVGVWRPVVVVPHAADSMPATRPRSTHFPIKVAAVGRLTAAKDPVFFAECIEAARSVGLELSAVWIGYSSDDDQNQAQYVRALDAAGVEIRPWQSRTSLFEDIRSNDIYVHTAEWEAFGLTIIESIAAGVPVVARRIPAIAEIKEIEFIESPQDFAQRCSELVPFGNRERVAIYQRQALMRFNSRKQRDALRRVYLVARSPTELASTTNRRILAPPSVNADGPWI